MLSCVFCIAFRRVFVGYSLDLQCSFPIDALDPEKLIQCPYDKNHQIRACRFPYHLVKCRKNHPGIVEQLVTCPFNARHQVPRDKISQHISSCDDKRCIEQDIVNVISSWQSPPCEEDWDKGENCQEHERFLFFLFLSPRSNPIIGHRSHLASGLRAPRTLPFVLPWKNYAHNSCSLNEYTICSP
uniref:Gametocyte specific factor 1 n=1 Tax=Pseudonaja textilis TaxID=8673 RepID=A0A670YWD4_PSETE